MTDLLKGGNCFALSKLRKGNRQGYLICYFCHELLTPRPNKIYGVDTRPTIDLEQNNKQELNQWKEEPHLQFETSSPVSQQKKEQENLKNTTSKPQKIKQQKTKAAKSKRPKRSKSPKRVKQKKQKRVSSPRKQVKEVSYSEKTGRFFGSIFSTIVACYCRYCHCWSFVDSPLWITNNIKPFWISNYYSTTG